MENKLKLIANTLLKAAGAAQKHVRQAPVSPNYPVFLENMRADEQELENERAYVKENAKDLPLISVLLDAFGEKETDVNSTVLSMIAQTYVKWELLIGVGLSYENADKYRDVEKVRLVMCADEPMKWIQKEMRGDFVMMLFAGDRLSPDALYLMSLRTEAGDYSMVYADSDQYDDKGNRRAPFFKPAYSPVSEACFGVIGRPLLVSKQLWERVGGFKGRGADEYRDFEMKCMKKAGSADHIPRVLLSAKRHELIVPEEEKKLNSELVLIPGPFEGSLRMAARKRLEPSVTIIIGEPRSALSLRNCLEAIDTVSSKKAHRIIVSVCARPEGDLMRYLEILKKNKAATVVIGGENGSLPRAFDQGAAQSFSEYLIFMSCDTIVLSPDFIEELIIPLMADGAAVSGGKLLSPDRKLLHTGKVIGLKGWEGSLYEREPDDMADLRKCYYTSVQRNVSAVSGLFMAVSSEDLANIGLFDDTLGEAGWDVEFCLRALKKHRQIIYTPFAEAISRSAPTQYDGLSKEAMQRCYDAYRDMLLSGDPYYSPNYDYRQSVPMLAIKPEKPIKLNPLF